MKHAFRNALIPLVTLVALNFGTCSAASSSPRRSSRSTGWASTSTTPYSRTTRIRVMAWLMVTATMIIVFNLLADLAYGFLDPRVRYD